MSARRRLVIGFVRSVVGGAVGGALLMTAGTAASSSTSAAPELAPARLVHRFLEIEISPDAAFVASVEGDSPPNGFYPPIRDLVVRRVRDGIATRIVLPCGQVPQCWPAAPAWAPDGKHLSFALRTPGAHAQQGSRRNRSGGADLRRFGRSDSGATNRRFRPGHSALGISARAICLRIRLAAGRNGVCRHSRPREWRRQLVERQVVRIFRGGCRCKGALRPHGHSTADRGAEGIARWRDRRLHCGNHERFWLHGRGRIHAAARRRPRRQHHAGNACIGDSPGLGLQRPVACAIARRRQSAAGGSRRRATGRRGACPVERRRILEQQRRVRFDGVPVGSDCLRKAILYGRA